MTGPNYRYFDSDTHFYETRDCFTRYIEPTYRDHAVHSRINTATGREILMVGDVPHTFLPSWSFEQVASPGALREMLRHISAGKFSEDRPVEPMHPAFTSRDARLSRMDEQNVESCIILPTLAITCEHFLKDDPGALYANHRAFNRWLDEVWGFDYRGRIFTPPLMSLRDLDMAVLDLEWALERGARIIHLRAGPAYGRSPADPYFDPFWARVNEAQVVVAFHIAESGYNEAIGPLWGEEPNPPSHKQSAFQWINFFGDRPIIDTISALIIHNLFGRYPDIKIASIENGSLWVSYVMKAMDKMRGMGRNGPWIGGMLTEKPSELFKRHVFVAPHHEEDLISLARLIGPSQVIFGSDYPHPEGLARPAEFRDGLVGLEEHEIRMIIRDNARQLLGLPT